MIYTATAINLTRLNNSYIGFRTALTLPSKCWNASFSRKHGTMKWFSPVDSCNVNIVVLFLKIRWFVHQKFASLEYHLSLKQHDRISTALKEAVTSHRLWRMMSISLALANNWTPLLYIVLLWFNPTFRRTLFITKRKRSPDKFHIKFRRENESLLQLWRKSDKLSQKEDFP